ncbi:hypothetical protein OG709_30015 [Streptomyces sp. NBC_01267]|uniref:hypothetical protein n=1 Tax=Streptomyces sp. NBC_01267 TaxID=2903805 RepID=UPI002E2FD76D|nr:hypothetical protein [Streptomyces sp. NBC_01267]
MSDYGRMMQAKADELAESHMGGGVYGGTELHKGRAEECPGPDCGPCDVDEYDRDERIEALYQGWGAREMAERIVHLEDELGADVDGLCTGMHADVAEAQAEIERLTGLLVSRRADNTADWTAVRAIQLMNEAGLQRDRYRLAWLSARRRAADEANHAAEALEWYRDEVSRLRAELEHRKAPYGPS